MITKKLCNLTVMENLVNIFVGLIFCNTALIAVQHDVMSFNYLLRTAF